MLAEYNDEWMVTRRYMSVGALEKAQLALGDITTAEEETEEKPALVGQLAA